MRKHANLLIALFMLMLSTGLPELQSYEDLDHLRKSLQCGKGDEEALAYFRSQLASAQGGSTYTRIDWFFHSVRHV